MKPRGVLSLRQTRTARVAAFLFVLGVAFLLGACAEKADESSLTTPYAPYTAGPVVREETPYAPYTAGPVVRELKPGELPYAPYTAGPVVREEVPYAPYTAGPVVREQPASP